MQSIPEMNLMVMADRRESNDKKQSDKLSRQCHIHEGTKIDVFMIFATGLHLCCWL